MTIWTYLLLLLLFSPSFFVLCLYWCCELLPQTVGQITSRPLKIAPSLMNKSRSACFSFRLRNDSFSRARSSSCCFSPGFCLKCWSARWRQCPSTAHLNPPFRISKIRVFEYFSRSRSCLLDRCEHCWTCRWIISASLSVWSSEPLFVSLVGAFISFWTEHLRDELLFEVCRDR